MNIESFTEKLHIAVEEALSGASLFLAEDMTGKPVTFMVFDGNDERKRDETLDSLPAALYGDGMFPTWVNLYVCDVVDDKVIVKCSYSNDVISELDPNTAGPFHVLIPTPPRASQEAFEQEVGVESSHDYDTYTKYFSKHRYSIKESQSYMAYTPKQD